MKFAHLLLSWTCSSASLFEEFIKVQESLNKCSKLKQKEKSLEINSEATSENNSMKIFVEKQAREGKLKYYLIILTHNSILDFVLNVILIFAS